MRRRSIWTVVCNVPARCGSAACRGVAAEPARPARALRVQPDAALRPRRSYDRRASLVRRRHRRRAVRPRGARLGRGRGLALDCCATLPRAASGRRDGTGESCRMKPPPFDYSCPESLDEALALLAEHGEDGQGAGGRPEPGADAQPAGAAPGAADRHQPPARPRPCADRGRRAQDRRAGPPQGGAGTRPPCARRRR